MNCKKLLMFSASFCVPCKTAKPHIDKYVDAYDLDFDYYLVDRSTEEGDKLSDMYGIKVVPTFIFLNENGEVIDRYEGWTANSPDSRFQLPQMSTNNQDTT